MLRREGRRGEERGRRRSRGGGWCCSSAAAAGIYMYKLLTFVHAASRLLLSSDVGGGFRVELVIKMLQGVASLDKLTLFEHSDGYTVIYSRLCLFARSLAHEAISSWRDMDSQISDDILTSLVLRYVRIHMSMGNFRGYARMD